MPMSPRLLRPRASGAFDPRTISDLGLWLDASNTSSLTFNTSTVSEWRDLSGNGRHFAQATAGNQPTGDNRTLNGLRVLDFDGNDVLLGNAASLDIARNVAGVTVFLVYAEDTSLFNRTLLLVSTANGTTSSRVSVLPTGTTVRVGGRRLDGDSFASVTSGGSNTNARVLSFVFDYANSDAFLYLEGALSGSTTSFQTDGNTSDTDSLATSIGSFDTGSDAMDGFMAEVLFYRRALSEAERQRVEGYLSKKWGIALA